MTCLCSFCDGVAHPATGCVYGPRTIACRTCTVDFWRWVRQHTNGRPRAKRGPTPAMSFYEAAGHMRGDT